ncbi:MAG TPA: BrnT family toxin [Thermoanaerobaculia bacterium]|nr:BrnT family toxin [Thermoanaerobaculia bacterium]
MSTARIRWDPEKANANWRKHHVTFFEAETVFHDPLLVARDDTVHSDEEDRFFVIGLSRADRILAITYTIRDEEAWIINARRATPAERRRYVKEKDYVRDEPPIDLSDMPELTDEFWSKAVRGLHYIPMTITRVSIADDVAEVFRTDDDVNDALRILINEGRLPPYHY